MLNCTTLLHHRRLGQSRPVTVHRLVTKGTVDQNILDIAERKLKLDAAILEGVTINGKAEAAAAKESGSGGRGSKADAADAKHMGAILASLLADA